MLAHTTENDPSGQNPEKKFEENLKQLESIFSKIDTLFEPLSPTSEEILIKVSDSLLRDTFYKNELTSAQSFEIFNGNSILTIVFRKDKKGNLKISTGDPLKKDEHGHNIAFNADLYIVLELLVLQEKLHRYQADLSETGPVSSLVSYLYGHFSDLQPKTIKWLKEWGNSNPNGVIELKPIIEELTDDN